MGIDILLDFVGSRYQKAQLELIIAELEWF